MARLRSAPGSQQLPASISTTAPQKTRRALKEKTNTTRPKGPVYEGDGNAEGLVKDARPRRGVVRAVVQQEDKYVMAGGLGAPSDSKTSERSAQLPTTDEIGRSDGSARTTVEVVRRVPPRMTRKVVRNEAQNDILEGVKQRMQATVRGRGARVAEQHVVLEKVHSDAATSDSLPTKPPPKNDGRHERSEFSISPSPPPARRPQSATRQKSPVGHPRSALRSHGTPAVESSILALKNFKRRPRQPSMLQMVQQKITSARPSMSNARPADDTRVLDLEDDLGDEEEFLPEAEGTPLHVRRKATTAPSDLSSAARRASGHQRASDSTRSIQKRKSDDIEPSGALAALHAKRRKSTTVAAPSDKPASGSGQEILVRSTPSQRSTPPPPALTSEAQAVRSSPSSNPPTEHSSPLNVPHRREDEEADFAVPSTERQQETIEKAVQSVANADRNVRQDETLAEPVSSSPPATDLRSTTKQTDIMADPLTQLSPPRPKRDRPQPEGRKKRAQAMTTATLQTLLPKRRATLKPRQRKSEYDIDTESEDDSPLDTSNLEEDEDELGARLRRQTKAKVPAKTAKGRASTAKAKARQSRAATQTRKSATAKKATRTYGRAAAATMSDKENEEFEDLHEEDSELPDTSISMYEAAKSKELEAANKKFAAVDEWDMEFESMSQEDHRSSSLGWR